MTQGVNLATIPLNSIDAWVQVYDLQTGFMNSNVLQAIGNQLENFVEICPKNLLGTWGNYMQVRVSLDLNHPMKRRLKIRKSAEDFFWVSFRYKNIPTFCFLCGLIGHS